MPISSAVKGMGSIKTIHTTKNTTIPNNEGSDFIKMYMLEKEKQRLLSEEKMLSLRQNTIQNRLQEIQLYYHAKSIQLRDQELSGNEMNSASNENEAFKTMSIDY